MSQLEQATTDDTSGRVRVDRWLWAIRVYKTRALSSEACRGGHVQVNGRAAKPATTVRVGDKVVVKLDQRVRDLEVVQLLDKRVGPALASPAFVDHSPPPIAPAAQAQFAVRDRGTGRPTKKDRRQLERLRSERLR